MRGGRGGSRGGRGGRGGKPTSPERKTGPDRKQERTNESGTTTQTKVADKKPAPVSKPGAPGPSTGPRSKQQQRLDNNNTQPSVDTTTSPPTPVTANPNWPTVGTGEVTTPAHIKAVRTTWDVNQLANLWEDLATREPDRADLIKVVQRQIISTELFGMMGGPNASRANIQVDGMPMTITATRDSKSWRKPDVLRTTGTRREQVVWNSSLRDTEVDTIRDIKAWANTLSRDALAEANEIIIDLVGTSGPCDACKDRLDLMANDVMNEWSRRTGLPLDKLPELQVWSYYGNPPENKVPERGGYDDVRNGWLGDRTPQDLEFRNSNGYNQWVREHPVIRVNHKPPVVTDTVEPEKSGKKPDTSTDKSETSQDAAPTDF